MRIEETCSCGASLRLSIDSTLGRLTTREREASMAHVSDHLAAWRKLHTDCRPRVAAMRDGVLYPAPVQTHEPTVVA